MDFKELLTFADFFIERLQIRRCLRRILYGRLLIESTNKNYDFIVF